MPSYNLEMKAEEERQRLHSSVTELKSRLHETLDIRHTLRHNLGLICSLAAAIGLAAGYSLTGIFVRRA
jgi:hypothetical protein